VSERPPEPATRDPEAEATPALSHALRATLTSLTLGIGMLDGGTLGPLNDAQREVIAVLLVEVRRLALVVDGALQADLLGARAYPNEQEW
jgi:hypothetical protein